MDLFAPVQPICTKIQASVTGLTAVGPVSMLTGTMVEITAKLPGVFVRPVNSDALSAQNVPTAFIETEDYEIVVAVPHGAGNIAPEFLAGPIAGAVIDALIGFQPAPQYQPLYFKGFGEASYLVGYAEFPLKFTFRFSHSQPMR